MKTWEHYKIVREQTISHEEIANRIVHCGGTLELKALYSILYLSMSRISEVCDYTYTGRKYKKIIPSIKFPPMKVENITIETRPSDNEEGYIRMMKIHSRVCKSAHISGKTLDLLNTNPDEFYKIKRNSIVSMPTKTAVMIEGKEDNILVEIIGAYIDSEQRFWDDEDRKVPFKDATLFNKSQTFYKRMCLKHLHLSPHNLRVIRAKVLMNERGYSISLLKELGGWKNADMAVQYAKSTATDIVNFELARPMYVKPDY